MEHWSDIYPHEIWTNIMVIDNKVIDYKIGGDKRGKGDWTIRWNDELRNRFNEVEVISTYEIVYDDKEHGQAFENGRQKVDKHRLQYGSYFSS